MAENAGKDGANRRATHGDTQVDDQQNQRNIVNRLKRLIIVILCLVLPSLVIFGSAYLLTPDRTVTVEISHIDSFPVDWKPNADDAFIFLFDTLNFFDPAISEEDSDQFKAYQDFTGTLARPTNAATYLNTLVRARINANPLQESINIYQQDLPNWARNQVTSEDLPLITPQYSMGYYGLASIGWSEPSVPVFLARTFEDQPKGKSTFPIFIENRPQHDSTTHSINLSSLKASTLKVKNIYIAIQNENF